jgi:TrmH family RNA methyltransferase
MVSKNQIKLITSLHQKKYRKQHGLFFVEGKKSILEFLNANFRPEKIYLTAKKEAFFPAEFCEVIDDTSFKKVSALSTPSDCLEIFKIPEEKKFQPHGLTVVLDAINDPGNLGTIIRLCDWFGISNIVCSEDTVDVYNPKVLQSTMGSFTRVHVYYFPIVEFFKKYNTQPILGTFMEGNSVYESEFPENGFLVFGNEANGISSEVEKLVTQKVSIPNFSNHQKTESLNVAMATSIFLSEYARKKSSGM